MQSHEGRLLRIFVDENDKQGNAPVYEWVIEQARKHSILSATAIRALEGFGADSRLHSAKLLRLSVGLPVIIEILDTPENIEAFLPTLECLSVNALITVESVRVLAHTPEP